MKKTGKILIYCGGNFEFQYKDFSPKLMANDYRAKILANVDKILYQPFNKNLFRKIGPNVYYVGPYYFYNNGLDGSNIVNTEFEMVEKCTHAIFLVDNINIPGTVSEIIHASLSHKNITIFFIKQSVDEKEPEKEICNSNWYPLQIARQIGNATLVECDDREMAKMLIYNYVDNLVAKNIVKC